MLPRMIDIARAKLPGGQVGEYQIGRGMSGFIFAKLGVSVPDFVKLVKESETDEDIANALLKSDYSALSARLRRVTVAEIPAEMRADFEGYYGTSLPRDMKFFDVLDADDAKLKTKQQA
jgi:hypothetical protein